MQFEKSEFEKDEPNFHYQDDECVAFFLLMVSGTMFARRGRIFELRYDRAILSAPFDFTGKPRKMKERTYILEKYYDDDAPFKSWRNKAKHFDRSKIQGVRLMQETIELSDSKERASFYVMCKTRHLI